MPIGPAAVARQRGPLQRRIAYRPSLVIINESRANGTHAQKADRIEGKVTDRWIRDTGHAPLQVRHDAETGINQTIQQVSDRLHEAIGSDKEGNPNGPGLGQTVVLRGSFTPEQIKKIQGAVKPLWVKPAVISTARDAEANGKIDRLVQDHTIKAVGQKEIDALAHQVDEEGFTHRAGFLISNFIHDRVINGGKKASPNAKIKPGSSALVMFDRPDLFGSNEDGSEEEFKHPERNYYVYRTETGTVAGRYRKIPRLPADDLSARIVRAFHGMEGNRDEEGNTTHLLTTRLSRVKERKKLIDQSLGYTPRTEGVLFIGTIPPKEQKRLSPFMQTPQGRLAACHFYSGHPLTRAAFQEMQRVAEHPLLNRKIVDLWKVEELLYTRYSNLARRILDLENHDPYTKMHSRNVAEWVQLIGRKLKLDRDTINLHRWSALVHDIGKLDVPTEVLHKPGDLLNEEWKYLKQHPASGARILRGERSGDVIVHGAETHHERWDGKGYPYGLKGEDIPLVGRIISVVDVIDAFLTEREYPRRLRLKGRTLGKRQFSWERVKELIRQFTNEGQFDPAVAKAALSITPGEFEHIYRNYKAPSTGRGIIVQKKNEEPWMRSEGQDWLEKGEDGTWKKVDFTKPAAS